MREGAAHEGLRNREILRSAAERSRVRSSGRASTTTQQVLALKNMLGAKVKIVQGYKGSADITLAMRRGEVSAMCGIAASNVLVQLKTISRTATSRCSSSSGARTPEFAMRKHL